MTIGHKRAAWYNLNISFLPKVKKIDSSRFSSQLQTK